jgi:hypothetical protein
VHWRCSCYWCPGKRLRSWRCSLRHTAQGLLNLRLHHLPKGSAQERLRQVLNVFWDALSDQEHRKILCEIVAIVQKEVIRLSVML